MRSLLIAENVRLKFKKLVRVFETVLLCNRAQANVITVLRILCVRVCVWGGGGGRCMGSIVLLRTEVWPTEVAYQVH